MVNRKTFANLILFFIIFNTFFNNLFVEFQLIVFKNIFISNLIFKLFILVLIFINVFVSKKINIKKNSIEAKLLCITFLILIILPFIILINNGNIKSYSNIIGQSYYIYLLSFFFLFSYKYINIKRLITQIKYIGLLNAFMCIAQYVTDSLIFLYTEYPDGTPIFNSTFFNNNGHTVRSVGLCSSGFDCGVILIFTLLLTINNFKKTKRFSQKIIFSIEVLILAFSIYTTKSRNIYLFAAYCISFLILYSIIKYKNVKNLFSKAVPILIIFVFIIIYFSGSLLDGSQNATHLFSVNTILIRFTEWEDAIKYFNSHPISSIFGFGLSQTVGIVTDNIFLDVIYTFGFIGLFIFSFFWIQLTKEMYKLIELDNVYKYLYVYVSSIFIVGVGNLISQSFGFLCILLPVLLICSKYYLSDFIF